MGNNSAKLKVIGVGGAGISAVEHMISKGLRGVEFMAIDTDEQMLEASRVPSRILATTIPANPAGAPRDSEYAAQAVLDSSDAFRELLAGTHMVFIVAGFGGMTGTGLSTLVADICRESKILTVVVAGMPLPYEGRRRSVYARAGVDAVKRAADTVIIIDNDRVCVNPSLTAGEAPPTGVFLISDQLIHESVRGITDMIMVPGLVCLDFADVRSIIGNGGLALMGIGSGQGEKRVMTAIRQAVSHPLFANTSLCDMRGIIMSVTSTSDITLDELTEACDLLYEAAGDDPDIIWSQVADENLGDEIRISVISIGADDTAW